VGLGPLPSAETQKKKIAWKDFWTEMPDFDCRDVTDFPYVDFINAHQGICGNDFQAAYRAATEEEQMMIEANAGQAEEEVQGKKGQKSKLWMTLYRKNMLELFDFVGLRFVAASFFQINKKSGEDAVVRQQVSAKAEQAVSFRSDRAGGPSARYVLVQAHGYTLHEQPHSAGSLGFSPLKESLTGI